MCLRHYDNVISTWKKESGTKQIADNLRESAKKIQNSKVYIILYNALGWPSYVQIGINNLFIYINLFIKTKS